MSSIIFDGNTYTFGATVSANLGTGTTSYLFGGLSFGSTFGFILRAFNGFGFSNFVGPALSKTLEQILETREDINAFAWSFQDKPIFGELVPSSGVTLNYFAATDAMDTSNAWRRFGSSTIQKGFTAPDGSTSAYKVSTSSSAIYNQFVFFDKGNTYLLSIYVNLSESSPSPSLVMGKFGWEQISPGTADASASKFFIPPGTTGWTRFVFMRNWTSDTRRSEVSAFRIDALGGNTANIILWGPQMEQAI
jgi:hypothetical protein